MVGDTDPDLLGVQEVLASPLDPHPEVVDDLCEALHAATGDPWNAVTSLTHPVDVAAFSPGVPAVTVDDAGA